MEIYCLLCGSKLQYDNEIDPEQRGYKENGIIGIYYCTNQNTCNAIFEVIDLDSDTIGPRNIYESRHIRYYFPKEL